MKLYIFLKHNYVYFLKNIKIIYILTRGISAVAQENFIICKSHNENSTYGFYEVTVVY